MSRSRRIRQASARKPKVSFDWRQLGKPCLLLAIATIVLYAPIVQHQFVNYDDSAYILANPHVQQGLDWRTVSWAFTHFYEANWHPLTWLAHTIDFQLYGAEPAGHHVTSLLFHLSNTLLLFLLLAGATGSVDRSALAAALFALHPLNVESVAWAAELKNLLCTFFFLLALGAYGLYARKPSLKRYAVVALFFALGLASKPMVITLPFVLLLLDFWPLGRIQGWTKPSDVLSIPQKSPLSLVLEKLPLLPLCIASAIVTVFAQQSAGAERMISVTRSARIANALYSYAMYLWKMVWPSALVPFYPHPSNSLAPWQMAAAALFLLLVTGLVWRASSKHPYAATGWLWYLGTLVPVIGLVQVGMQARADRYAYIPLIGVFVIVAWGWADFAEARNWSGVRAWGPALAALALLAGLTWRQISFWDNSYSLWSHALEVSSNNQVAEHNMANELIRTHRPEEALPHLLKAIELNPHDMPSIVNLGAVYATTGRHQEAIQEFEIVLQQTSDPRLLLPVYQNLSNEHRLIGDAAGADEYYRQFLRMQQVQASVDGIAAQAQRR